jgi:hypothetical protein
MSVFKKLLILIFLFGFLASSCRSGKDLNIHVDHSKEKKTYQKPANKKYKK